VIANRSQRLSATELVTVPWGGRLPVRSEHSGIGGLIYAIVNSVKADEQTARDEDTWYKQLQTGFAPTAIAVPDLGTLLASASGSVPDGPINNTAQ